MSPIAPAKFMKQVMPGTIVYLRRLCLALLAVLLSACDSNITDNPDPGVALALAEYRATAISDLHYDLQLTIPESPQEAARGTVVLRFTLENTSQPLVLDFRAPPDHVLSVMLNGRSVEYFHPQDHIVIPTRALSRGEQTITVVFRSTEAALNRQSGFMYALFVPDRASTAFPVFEQPDLKARFTLTLTVPSAWEAISNSSPLSRKTLGNSQHQIRFAETAVQSTYLFTFAAGRFQIDTAERNGRMLTMYHRETDVEKLQRNREAIFDLHATALAWLEDYTGIPYPFDKFAFFAVPAFQFGGMEHPGAVWYRAESLFLDPSASRTQELGRASLIAHETAHMWFGDLVTMRWFNDVWMKEVFANFMAAKIAGPAFPISISICVSFRHIIRRPMLWTEPTAPMPFDKRLRICARPAHCTVQSFIRKRLWSCNNWRR
jgi:aminopeptidase N